MAAGYRAKGDSGPVVLDVFIWRFIIGSMNDPNHRRFAAFETIAKTVAVSLRNDDGKRVGPAGGMMAIFFPGPFVRQLNESGAVAVECPVDVRPAPGGWEWIAVAKRSATVAWLVLGVGALSACSNPVDCSGGSYRGDCLPGTPGSVSAASGAAPASVSRPANVGPASVGPASVGPTGVSVGDPRDFADMDDKQCRSYGLTFGSRDYADCRIRLSAQHRGLDPNIGAGAPGPAVR
jgi:hypothetical protein